MALSKGYLLIIALQQNREITTNQYNKITNIITIQKSKLIESQKQQHSFTSLKQ